ncbi:MAG: arginine--tRNA ligase [Candidatus Woesearchaeota archaeon]
MIKIFEEIISTLKKAGITCVSESELEFPPEPEMGDIAYPCFGVAKETGKRPNEIASQIAFKIAPTETIRCVKAVGPYINFFLAYGKSAEIALDMCIQPAKQEGTVMVEYSSPNTNKPLHLGHLRNISIGQSVCRLIEFSGKRVVHATLVNDRGIHICKSMVAYLRYGQGIEPNKKPDHFVGDYYVLFNKMAKEDPTLDEEAKELLLKWERGDKETIKLWKKMNQWAIEGFNETYNKLGVRFEKIYYESDIFDKGKELVKKGLAEGRFILKDGAIVAQLEDLGLPDKVLVRSDGTGLYVTQDLYLAKKKFEDYQLDQSIYVVASEQNLHFKQLFALLRVLGEDIWKRCIHLSYGMVFLPEGKMKSREGTVVDADEIIDELTGLARTEIQKRHLLDSQMLEERARKIALAALRFYLLKNDITKDIVYDPKESISFEGETGPYILYTYARIQSILRKQGSIFQKPNNYSCVGKDEHLLFIKLLKYQLAVKEAVEQLRPSTICHYLLELCKMFNDYYQHIPILKAHDTETKNLRLSLANSIATTILSGLRLLEIEAVEEM